jgi:hypothetical protein
MDDETLGALRDILDYIDEEEVSGYLDYEERERRRAALKENVALVRKWLDG